MEKLKKRERAEEEEKELPRVEQQHGEVHAEAGTTKPPQSLGADVTRRARGGGDGGQGRENLDGVDNHNIGQFENQKILNNTKPKKIDSENIDNTFEATYTNTGKSAEVQTYFVKIAK